MARQKGHEASRPVIKFSRASCYFYHPKRQHLQQNAVFKQPSACILHLPRLTEFHSHVKQQAEVSGMNRNRHCLNLTCFELFVHRILIC